MPTKLQFYSELAERSTLQLTKSRDNWTEYLTTASRLYKYPFREQVMIYAQRPNATACATYETWNKSMNRYVRRGSKGIALIDMTTRKPYLKYVFDVADTGNGRTNSRRPYIWELKPEHEPLVKESLSKSYGDLDGNLADIFHNIAYELAKDYYNDNATEIVYSIENGLLEDYDEDNLRTVFCEAATVSITYSLMLRCGLDADKYFNDDDFNCIFDFNSSDSINALGTAVSSLSEQILREVEVTIKKYERQKAAERSTKYAGLDLYNERGLSDTRHNIEGRTGGSGREIWHDASRLSGETPSNNVQFHVSEREVVPTPVRSGQNSEQAARTAYDGVRNQEPTAEQSDGSNGLGSAYEHAESTSGRIYNGRTDIQLEDQAQGTEAETVPFSIAEIGETTPKPIFIKNDRDVHSMDLSAYNDGDIIGYNSKGVEFQVSRMGEHTFITTTTKITPLGEILGADSIPADIMRQIRIANGYETEPDMQAAVQSSKTDEAILENEMPENLSEPQAYKYYSVRRPVDIGTYPRENAPVEIVNFDRKQPVEDGLFEAWGYLIYSQPLTAAQIQDYELRAAPGIETALSEINGSQVGNHLLTQTPAIPDGAPLAGQSAQTTISMEAVDVFLRDGGNKSNSILRIAAYYMKNKSPDQNVKFLKREFKSGGKGIKLNNQQISVWFDENGMTFGDGTESLRARNKIHLSWEQIDSRIRELLDKGIFIPQHMFEQAIENEYTEVAQRLWYFYHDDMRDMPEAWKSKSGGFAEDVEVIKSIIKQREQLTEITIKLVDEIEELYKEHPPRRFWHDPIQLMLDLADCTARLRKFMVNEIPTVDFTRFITEDEIDTFLTKGSNVEESKYRIFSYFLMEHSAKEREDFIKNEYSSGGGSHALSGADDSWYDGMHGKITLKRGGCDDINLTWSMAAKRINTLINEGHYMSREELNRLPEYEKKILAREIVNFYYNLPSDMQRPFNVTHDISSSEEIRDILEMLDNPVKVSELINAMEPIWKATHPDDRYYKIRNNAYHDIIAYQSGTFTLFPQLSAITPPEEAVISVRSTFETPSEPNIQLSLFPTEEQQRETIIQAEEEQTSAVSISDDEINELICQAVDDPIIIQQIQKQFTESPRSREAAKLLKEVYGGCEYTMARKDDIDGYIGILGEDNGVAISKGESSIELLYRNPPVILTLPWAKLHKRVAELVENGQFSIENTSIPIETVDSDIKNAEVQDKQETPETSVFNQQEANTPTEYSSTYEVGDIVYLENEKPYLITNINFDIRLIDPEMQPPRLPINRSEMRDNFERLLYKYPRNHQFTDYLHSDLSKLHPAMREVLTEALIKPEHKAAISVMLAKGRTNPEIAEYLSRTYWRLNNNYTLANGTSLTYSWHQSGLQIELDKYKTRITQTWKEIAGICRSLNKQELEQAKEIAEKENDTLIAENNPVEQKLDNAVTEKNYPQHENTVGISLDYAVGDTVYLEDKRRYVIDEIRNREISLLDPNGYLPIFRAINIPDFEELLRENPLNSHLITVLQNEQSSQEEIKPEADTEQRKLGKNQQVEIIDGVEFVFTGVKPVQEAPLEQGPSIEQSLEQKPQNLNNFKITDNHLGEGGAKTKYNYNIEAIRTLKEIEAENRFATPKEQEILSRYVGWGGLAQAFDGENDNWKKEYAALKSLLTPGEYDMARASTLNAHYTSPTVIKAIFETVERMGFKTGNILEPACGVGNFFGLLPENMRHSKLYGVELDSITGRIAKQLYQKANISVTGFEKTDMPNSFFDLAIGNVPFGGYKVVDKKYDKHNFLIHDYFFAKTLDQVRPGGIIAFVTSKGTMDKQNPEVRKYIAQRAELLGAVRLPNNAFLKNAGTEVTSDILFFQKRDRMIDIKPDWVNIELNDDNIPVNSYFANNPHMILGTMAFDDRMYGNKSETTCIPIPGADLTEQLKTALSNIQGEITEPELDDVTEDTKKYIEADPYVKNFSYTLIGKNDVYYRENSRMYPVDLPKATLERIKGMIALRDCTHTLIGYQLNDYSDADIAGKQAELNRLYDDFTNKYGLINSRGNSLAFSNDTSYYLLCSLEVLDENRQLARKADIFTKRTIKQKITITSVDTASEALAVSIAEKACVDLNYMAQLMNGGRFQGSENKIEDIVRDLQGVIFKDPLTGSFDVDGQKCTGWQTADEYLSGNVREKLAVARKAAETHPEFTINVKSLEMAQPKDLDASEIAVRLGTTWIDKKYVEQFMYELLETPYYQKKVINVNYSERTGEWGVSGIARVSPGDVLANITYGTSRINAYGIIRDTLNLKDTRIYDTFTDAEGKEHRELNKRETTLAQQKQESIKQAFKDWIFKAPERRQTLVKLYNERFNCTRPREYDGKHINFQGINPEIKLQTHQLNAVARILYGGNTLLAHVVGAGKTYEMVAAAMESKRLGLCQKSLFAVPNHLTEQWGSAFLTLYPSANILVATAKDFEMKNRRKFCSKIATSDFDAVIIGHSQLLKIPMSKERQERLLNEQIWDITEGIEELRRDDAPKFSIKQLEKTRKSLEARLEKLTDQSRKDSVVTFEQLGVDRLFVDESHNFKNLFLYTKMRNVAGLSQTDAQKSSDLFMKCMYMDELTGGKGIVFATGTPISNSLAEMYSVQRYLQYEMLQRKNLTHFDSWASTFSETVTAIELAPEGSSYRARTRLAKFYNLPELMNMFKETADIQTADMLNLPRPEVNYHTIVVPPSEIQKEMVAELSERAADVQANKVDPSVDNMLKITSDGRKIGLDQRLMNSMLPDDENSKVNACMNKVYQVWEDTKTDRLTQLVFCDFSTPNSDGRFNVYTDIKAKLIEKGIPENEISFIHDATTEARKEELFAKVRNGQVRVLFGSTAKMGAGTNVQDRLIMLHDLDCPWRPSDLEQRSGRIIRRGNNNPVVDICRYVTEGTFDAYLWQTVEKKQQFISQIMSSKSPVRSCEDVDETSLSFAEIKALCAGNPLIKEKMDLDIEVARLRLLKADYQSQHYRLEDTLLKHFPENLSRYEGHIEGFKRDISLIAKETKPNEDGFSPMEINGVTYTEKGEAGAALLEACKQIKNLDDIEIGSYRGFEMSIAFGTAAKEFTLTLKGNMRYRTKLGDDTFGNITRINNALAEMQDRLKSAQSQLENTHQQIENAKLELQKPFQFEQELTEKSARLALLDAELNMDKGGRESPEHGEKEAAAKQDRVSAKSSKPSILESIKTGTVIGRSVDKTEKIKRGETSL